MFRRVLAPSIPFALAVLWAMSFSRAQTSPATLPATGPATTPATAPEPIVANPHYLAWAPYKPGTQIELDVISVTGGQKITTHVVTTLTELTPDRAVVRSVATLNLAGVLEDEEHTQTHTFDARVPQSQADRAVLPPGGEGELTEVGTERLDTAGRAYETQVREFNGKIQNSPAKGKQWRSAEVPGGLVKMQSTSGNMEVEMILTKVTTK